MSRLYEALERISRAEQKKKAQDLVEIPVEEVASHSERRMWWRGWIVVAVSMMFVAVLVLIPLRWPSKSPHFLNNIRYLFQSTQKISGGNLGAEEAKIQKRIGPVQQQTKRIGDAKKDPVDLNNRAVKLLKKGAYWDALYLLDEAIKIEPHLEAPYYNSVYALIQLGYYGAAQAYCQRILRLFGETEWVKRNKSALEGLGIYLDKVATEADGA